MTDTLESLYRACHESDDAMRAYDKARAAKVAEIADYLKPHLSDPDTAPHWAAHVMGNAEGMGRIDGDEVTGEIPSRATLAGNPLPFSI